MPDQGSMMVSVFDGTRQPISPDIELLIRIRDGFQDERSSKFHRGPNVLFRGLPVFDNFGDNYTVVVSASGFVQAGFFPVKISQGTLQSVSLMLLPSNARFNFDAALLPNLQQTHRQLFDLFVHGAADEQAANERYENLMDVRPEALAALLNITTAMADILMPVGKVLDYFKELIWDETMQQDRFFGFAENRLVEQVKIATAHGTFVPSSTVAHPGATSSFRQAQFGEANVQLSFHEGERRTIDNVDCVKVESDIDYFKDLASHVILEVLPHFFTGGDTDPKRVYALRWIAGQHAGVPEFSPPYTIVAS